MSTVFSGGTCLHWAKTTELQYFVQNWENWAKRDMNGWGALQEILVLALVHTGSCKTWTIGKGGQKLKCKGKANILKEREQEQNVHWVRASRSGLCGYLQRMLQNWKITVHTFTWTGPQASRGAFLTTGNCMGTSVALLDCKRKGHSHRQYEQSIQIHLVHTVHSGSSRKATIYPIYNIQ